MVKQKKYNGISNKHRINGMVVAGIFVIIAVFVFYNFSANANAEDSKLSDQEDPSIAVDNNDNVYMVWQDERNGNWDIYFAKSTDGGKSFGTNIRVNDDTSTSNQGTPSITIDKNEDIYIVWADERNGNYDIYFSKSTNGGESFNTNVRVNDDTGSSSQSAPSLAVDGNGNVYIVWTDGRNKGIDDYNLDIYFAKSTNGGGSYNTNIPVNDNIGLSSQKDPSITIDRSGNIFVVWTDKRNKGSDDDNSDIYFAKSNNGSSSFDTDIRVNDDTGIHYQSNPSIAIDNDGNIYVVWMDCRNGEPNKYNYDIYLAKSTDEGTSFNTNVRVDDSGSENLKQKYPSIAIDKNGYVYVAWCDTRNKNSEDSTWEIYFAKSINGGTSFNTNVKVEASSQVSPSIAVDGEGNVYIGGESRRKIQDEYYYDIFFTKSTNGGISFGNSIKVDDIDTGTANKDQDDSNSELTWPLIVAIVIILLIASTYIIRKRRNK